MRSSCSWLATLSRRRSATRARCGSSTMASLRLWAPSRGGFFGARRDRSAVMDLAGFRASLSAPEPPALCPALRALWLDARGNWDGAHDSAQADEGGAGDWVHAYLHRKEGDAGNAAYWYRRARKPVCRTSLDEEWAAIADALLKGES